MRHALALIGHARKCGAAFEEKRNPSFPEL